MPKTQQEIVQQGYQALVQSLGTVDALRFIQHFSPGQGDYTEERHTTQPQPPLEEILAAIRDHREDTTARYDEIIE